MAYNIVDLIERIIDTSNKILMLYQDNSKNKIDENFSNIIIKVFIKHQNEKISYYKSLQEKLKKEKINEIHCFTYDKIASLIGQFNNKVQFSPYKNMKELMENILNIDKDVRALYIDIRGRLMENKQYCNTEYNVLTDIIHLEEKYLADLERLYKESYEKHL